ncbi:MAG: NUDIX domain-containing protein [Sandaracinus sp.]|nr:NUDIX domain-containing protein [Sandaracinus sp.]
MSDEWHRASGSGGPPPAPSASVVLVRDSEVLLLRRNATLAFHGGAWVFPGGRCDGPETPVQAAVRETFEEAGLQVQAERLVRFARWTTPEGRPRRFVADFFLADAPEGEVVVDGGEIVEARWWRPSEALKARDAGALVLPPPTFVTLWRLAHGQLARDGVEVDEILPVSVPVSGGTCALYPGDAGYATASVDARGRRHRAWLLDAGWRYERDVGSKT